MDEIRKYLLSLLCAGMICSVINTLAGKKTATGMLIHLITGLFLTVTLISPLVNIQLTDYFEYFNGLSLESSDIVCAGEIAAKNELCSIIKSKTEAYILDKAGSLDAELDVEVTVNDNNPPVPCGVTITGSISPYSKEVLSRYIAKDLGIPKEDQNWI